MGCMYLAVISSKSENHSEKSDTTLPSHSGRKGERQRSGQRTESDRVMERKILRQNPRERDEGSIIKKADKGREREKKIERGRRLMENKKFKKYQNKKRMERV